MASGASSAHATDSMLRDGLCLGDLDWVDTHVMDDPEDSKPDDWVTEKRVVDGEAEKPDDSDDEEDGEWDAPTKDNPEYKSDTSVGESANFTVVESVESATASTDQPMDPAEA